jgi:hypothetical protein
MIWRLRDGRSMDGIEYKYVCRLYITGNSEGIGVRMHSQCSKGNILCSKGDSFDLIYYILVKDVNSR